MTGKTEPRLWTRPLAELTETNTLGFACIEYATTVLRKTLYPWQEWALIHSLEIVGDLETGWHFRYRVVLFLISRQNGKTVLSEVLASFFPTHRFMNSPGKMYLPLEYWLSRQFGFHFATSIFFLLFLEARIYYRF